MTDIPITTPEKDPKQYVTPAAFKVSPALYGTPLATPIRRAFALLIDFFLVSMLTHVNSLFLAAAASIIFLKAGSRLKNKDRFSWARGLLRGLAAILLFVVVLAVFETANNNADQPFSIYTADEPVDGEEAAMLIAVIAKHALEVSSLQSDIEDGTCDVPLACWQPVIGEIVEDIVWQKLPEKEANQALESALERAQETLNEEDFDTLASEMRGKLETLRADAASEQKIVSDDAGNTVGSGQDSSEETADEDAQYSFLKWAEGALEDLGIGFGWGAVYFTIFGTWLNGQTPGKKLCKIRVVKLDGKPMNLWENFERYGGYGAGLATGLLGFFKVFWDRNRQGIHDKISETVVVDLRKPKVALQDIAYGEPSQNTA